MYRLTNWSTTYERNRTREIKRLDWIAAPILIDRDDFAELVDHPDGAAHAGVFYALQQVAARSPVRGDLLRPNGQPHDSRSLARLTRLPEGVIADALPRLIVLGWMEIADATAPTRDEPAPSCGIAAPACDATAGRCDDTAPDCGKGAATEQNRTEQNKTKDPPAPDGGGFETSEASEGQSQESELPSVPAPRRQKPAADTPLPPDLDTPEFVAAWDRWVTHRREKRKPLTPSTMAAQIAECAKWGVARAVESINLSIRCGWTGLFETPQQNQPPPSVAAKPLRPSRGERLTAMLAQRTAGVPT